MNHGAMAVRGGGSGAEAGREARGTASADRLRCRIMTDSALSLLTGPYDLIVGTFDLAHDDLHTISRSLSGLLRHNGQFLAAVTTPLAAAAPKDGLNLNALFTEKLTIDSLYQVSDTRLSTREHVHFVFSSRGEH